MGGIRALHAAPRERAGAGSRVAPGPRLCYHSPSQARTFTAGERSRRAAQHMARIIAIANQKGGVGKTATTANLGASLTLLDRRVLLIDMDPQGNLTAAFGLEKQTERTIADALLDRQCPLPIVGVNHQSHAGLDLVPSAIPLAGAEAALMNKLGRELRLRDQLSTVEEAYDYILIDTPPALGRSEERRVGKECRSRRSPE